MTSELAMLFCHSGSDVFFVLSDAARRYCSEALVADLTGNQALTPETSPGWLKSRHRFDIALIAEPQWLEPQTLPDAAAALFAKADYINLLCCNPTGGKSGESFNLPRRTELPPDPAELPSFYQQLFARQLRRLASRQALQGHSYHLSDDIATEPGLRLLSALDDLGFVRAASAAESTCRFFRNGTAMPATCDQTQFFIQIFDCETSFSQAVAPQARALHFLTDSSDSIRLRSNRGERLIPSIGRQCCYDRFSEILRDFLSENPQS